MKDKLQAIIMAAGRSSRFKMNRSKLAEKICGQEMIIYTTKTLDKLNVPTSVVVGYQKEVIKSLVNKHHKNNVSFVEQEEQKGTAHALMCSKPLWEKENILLINADVPLINSKLIDDLYQKHIKSNSAVSFVTAHNLDPSLNSYGKVIEENGLVEIIEAKDYLARVKLDPKSAKDEDCCINAGIYIFKKDFLVDAIKKINKSSVTNEFYITDLVHIASQEKLGVEMLDAPVDAIRGINTMRELWIAEQVKQAEIINHWMDNGVRFQAAQNTYIEIDVTIDSGSFIGQGAQIYGKSHVSQECVIEPFSIIKNSTIGKNSTIKSFSVIENSNIKDNVSVGPLANIKSDTTIENNCVVDSFVEIKASHVGIDSNIKQLSYIGNTHIGEKVRIGAGTIICDNNGFTDSKTIIASEAFIGGNNTLVAPITIGKNAYTGAGSTLTKNVPSDALSIARAGQINKDEYTKKLNKNDGHKFTGAIKTTNDSSTTEL